MVEALGEGVQGFASASGLRLTDMYRLGEYGVYGEKAIVPARACCRRPRTWPVLRRPSGCST